MAKHFSRCIVYIGKNIKKGKKYKKGKKKNKDVEIDNQFQTKKKNHAKSLVGFLSDFLHKE